MAYSIIPFVAIFVHILVNYDIFQRNNPLASKRSYRSYRFFLVSSLALYLSDALWGLFFEHKLVIPGYIATYSFFSLMAVTVFSWSSYVIDYLNNKENILTKIFRIVCYVFIASSLVLLIVNFFQPFFFSFSEDGLYNPLIGRTIFFIVQMVLFGLTAVYVVCFAFKGLNKNNYSKFVANLLFSLIMCVTIGAQIAYAGSPIYSAGLLVGLTIVRLFIASEERNDFYQALKESREREEKKQIELTNTKEMMNIDTLTGVKSKYAYVELEENIDSLIAKGEIERFAVIVIDLNDLKYVNDKLGHDEGDRYLVESTRIINKYFSDYEVYRFGGDEFVVFINNENYDKRHRSFEAFNKEIEKNIDTGNPILAAGISDFVKERDNTYRAVFERADERMYVKKSQLKKIGKINLAKFYGHKNKNTEEAEIENVVFKDKEIIEKTNNYDPRIAFYKTFYYSENLPLIDLLNSSSCDEIVEVNVNDDSFTLLHHVDGKYFVPLVELSYNDLFDFTCNHIVHADDKEIYLKLMNPEGFFERLKNNEIPNFDYAHFRYRLQDGGYRYVEQVIITGEENGIADGFFRIYIFDIQNLKNRQFGYSSNDSNIISKGRDEVTNLLVEKEFLKKASGIVENEADNNWCLVSIDIEHFRFFTEWFGKEKGDFLLAKIGATLSEVESVMGGLTGYFGKDDFVLLTKYNKEKIEEVYEKLRNIILSFGLSAGFMPAFGIAMIEKDLSLVDAFDRSKIAVSKAKSDIRNRICVYDKEMQFLAYNEYRLLSEFMNALKNHEITFFLQPQCRISSKKIVGGEALARWIKADGTHVPPADFIPVLEKYGFIPDLDQYLWEEVCKWIKNRLDNNLPTVSISVNVSRVDIFAIDIAKVFADLTKKYNIPHNLIKIEITESSYAENTDLINDLVISLKKDGFVVLMDDFGNGYSSLNMLSNVQIDAIKLDAQFLHFDTNNIVGKGMHILESVINMAKIIAVPIIVEGVENKEQCDFLENLGCRYIQGFYFYRPMPKDEFAKIIDNENNIDNRGFVVKLNEQFRIREFMDRNIYSDSMLNDIIGAVAFYSWRGEETDIVRFNEQFYQAVGVPDFADRLTNIERFLHKDDIEKMHSAFAKAMENRLNGYTENLRFYRTDGSLSTFGIHFYYLGNKEGGERFYGSAIDMTELTHLKEQVAIFANHSKENLIFARRVDNKWCFTLAAHGLSDVFDTSVSVLEKEMNEGMTKDHFVNPDCYDELMHAFDECYSKKINLTKEMEFFGNKGTRIKLLINIMYVGESASTIDLLINSKVVK